MDAMRTWDVATSAIRRSRPGSSSATAVSTVCSRPAMRPSMRPASVGSCGLPSSSPSITTTVSAASTSSPGCARAAAFATANRSTMSRGSSSGSGDSSRSAARTVKRRPRLPSSSRRRGEEEARMREGLKWVVARPDLEGVSSRVIPPHGLRFHPRLVELHLAGAELLGVAFLRRLIGEQVLRAQLLLDRVVDPFQLARLLDEEEAPAGLVREARELQAHVGFLGGEADAHGVESHAAAAGVLQRLGEGVAAPLVLAVGEEDERPLPLDAAEVVEAVDDAVVEGGVA